MESKIEGNKLILTVDLSQAPTQSKSALEKAIAKGTDPAKVPATLVASSGGFIRVGKYKVSANVMLA